MSNSFVWVADLHWLASGFNAALMTFCFLGATSQWLELRRRRRRGLAEASTALLSLRQFSSSFVGAFGTFLFAYSAPTLEHALVWPRLASACAYIAILWEIQADRRSTQARAAAWGWTFVLVGGLASVPWRDQLGPLLQAASAGILVAVAVILAFGYGDQIQRVWHHGSTGALSKRMIQFILAMDLSTLALAATIGPASLWPVVLVASVSAVTKVVLLVLFRWVRVSPRARQRRIAVKAPPRSAEGAAAPTVMAR